MRYIVGMTTPTGTEKRWRELSTDGTGKVVRDREVQQDPSGAFYLPTKLNHVTGETTRGHFDPDGLWNGNRDQ